MTLVGKHWVPRRWRAWKGKIRECQNKYHCFLSRIYILEVLPGHHCKIYLPASKDIILFILFSFYIILFLLFSFYIILFILFSFFAFISDD